MEAKTRVRPRSNCEGKSRVARVGFGLHTYPRKIVNLKSRVATLGFAKPSKEANESNLINIKTVP